MEYGESARGSDPRADERFGESRHDPENQVPIPRKAHPARMPMRNAVGLVPLTERAMATMTKLETMPIASKGARRGRTVDRSLLPPATASVATVRAATRRTNPRPAASSVGSARKSPQTTLPAHTPTSDDGD